MAKNERKRERRGDLPQPFQSPWNGIFRQHDNKIQIPDRISCCPGEKHSRIGQRGRSDIRKCIVDGPDLDGAGKHLRKGSEHRGADDSCKPMAGSLDINFERMAVGGGHTCCGVQYLSHG